MENLSLLIDTIINNLKHGQEIVYQSYSPQRQEDTIIYQIETYGVNVFMCTETYIENQYDAGGYSSHPHAPRFYPLRLHELNQHLSSTIKLSSTIYKGGLPFLFYKKRKDISLFDIYSAFDYKSPFRICEYYSYLTSNPYAIHKYNIASGELIEYGYYKEDTKNNSHICSGIDYSSKPNIKFTELPQMLPLLFLNNRYLFYKDLEYMTLIALDDKRITWRLDDMAEQPLFFNWILIEMETRMEISIGMVNKENQAFTTFNQDTVPINNPIFCEFLKVHRFEKI